MKTLGFRQLLVILTFCAFWPITSNAQISEELDLFISWISGSFSVSSNTETEEVSLCSSRIWDEKENGAWIYLESQGLESTNVFKQSIYFISEITESEFSLDKYELKKPEPLKGGCSQTDLFVGLTPFDLYYMKGCAIFFSYDGFQFSGVSNTGKCKEAKSENEYIVSDFILTVNDLTILDKWYNQNEEEIKSLEKVYTKIIKEK